MAYVQIHQSPCACLQAALLQANGGALTAEMLNPLSRAVPQPKEAADIRLFLQVQYAQSCLHQQFNSSPLTALTFDWSRLLLCLALCHAIGTSLANAYIEYVHHFVCHM